MTDREPFWAELPVFPLLGALLLPHGKLPLNVFEPRYLAMVEDALGGERMIGMIQPDEAHREGENGPALFNVGCAGRLTSFSETDDGRYLITLTGTTRFRVAAEIGPRRGYRRVRADPSGFTRDRDPPTGEAQDRERLLSALRVYFQARGFDANWSAIEEMDGPGLVTTLSMVCPFDPVEKQALLEAPDLVAREATLLTLLQMGAHSSPENRPVS